jgi:CO/xanthine dehydrogenase Mo-binding subunit
MFLQRARKRGLAWNVAKNGAVRVRRVVCAVDCGTVVNPDTVRAQIQSAIIFGITAALHGEITLKNRLRSHPGPYGSSGGT